MVDIEKIINYIKEARRKGFRDDFIKKSLLELGYSELKIDDAFLNAGRPKRQNFRTRTRSHHVGDHKTSVTILLEKWLKDALDKKAEEDGLTLYNKIKKTLVESIHPSEIPKGVFPSKLIRKKLTDEEKSRHKRVDMRYKARVEKERRVLKRARRKKKRLFG